MSAAATPVDMLGGSRRNAVAAMAAAAGLSAWLLSGSFGLTVAAVLPVLVTTFFLWNPMVVDRSDVSLGGAAALGIIVVTTAYPFMLAIGLPLETLLSGGEFAPTSPNGSMLSDMTYFFAFSVVYGTFFGLLITGWVTVPLGVAIAMLVAWWTRRQLRRAAPPGPDV